MRPDFIPEKFSGLGQAVKDWMTKISILLRGGLTLHDNVKQQTVSHTFGSTPDTAEDIDISALALSWTPSYFLVLSLDVSGAVVMPEDTGNWTASLVKASCNVADATVVLWVF